MEKVLVVSSSDKLISSISELIEEAGSFRVFSACNGNDARGLAGAESFSSIIVCSPVANESSSLLACSIARSTSSLVILIVKNNLTPEEMEKYEKAGVFVLSKPVSKPLFFQTFKLVCSLQNRLSWLKSENSQLKVKLDETKIIGRAKCVLIQYLGMTEPMAHRYIEKQAMDMRLSKTTIAENILKTYEY
jgi:two-component system, response regulator PdtaR